MLGTPQHYAVFSTPSGGGKPVTVYPMADVQASQVYQELAQRPGITVFLQYSERGVAKLCCYTATGPKSESDSASIAVLHHLGLKSGESLENADGFPIVWKKTAMGYMLHQGTPAVSEPSIDRAAVATHLGLDTSDLHEDLPVLISNLGRPNLIVPVRGTLQLDAIEAEHHALVALAEITKTTGVVAYTFPGRQGCFLDCRAFAPLRGFLEDQASSNMLACALGATAWAQFFDDGTHEIWAAQGYALGQPSRLGLQAEVRANRAGVVWVGGMATALPAPTIKEWQ
jgi:PhzF family phenazine biosynthesis protein